MLNLWIEVVISGWFYLFAIFFLILKFLKVHDLFFLLNLKDYVAPVSVGVVVTSYLLGIIAHRLTPPVLGPVARLIERRVFHGKRVLTINQKNYRQVLHTKVQQYGSARLNREIDFQFSTLALFTQLTLAVPLLGLSTTFWLIDTAQRHLALPVLLGSLAAEVGIFISYRRQRSHYMRVCDAAFGEADSMQKQAKERD